MSSHEYFAEKLNPNGSRVRYRTREEYQRGRFSAAGSMAAQRAGINRAVGGNIL